MAQTVVVIGSGFRAFCSCLHLSENKENRVIMLDSSKIFGGVMNSRQVQDFSVDNGVHMFDSVPVELGNIVSEIMSGDIIDIDFVSESSFGDKITQGYSLPDLTALPNSTKMKIKRELLEKKDVDVTTENISSIYDYFIKLYGTTAGEIFIKIFEKLYNISSKEIDASAIITTSLARLKFLSDEEMIELKSKSKRLDSVLAARRKSQGKLDDLVSIYPKSRKGMRGWCENAILWLQNVREVNVRLDTKITHIKSGGGKISIMTNKGKIIADKVVWANDRYSELSTYFEIDEKPEEYLHSVPMIFITLATPKDNIKDFTYIQNFNLNGICNRFAASGRYSDQVSSSGLSFITAECPAAVGSVSWNNYETLHSYVWSEAKNLKVVKHDSELAFYNTIRVPKTVKMKKMGFDDVYSSFIKKMLEKEKNILIPSKMSFFRREIFLQSKELLEI